MRSPAETLVRWLSARMEPLGVTAKELMHPDEPSRRPWYVPALRGGAVDEDGCSARQIALGGVGMKPDLELLAKLKSMYISALNSNAPMRWCLACLSAPSRIDWSAARIYPVPYASDMQAHVVAIQLAVAIQDLAGAAEVREGNTFLARTVSEAFGVFEGQPLGRLKQDVVISDLDVDSILNSSRAISHETIRAPVLAMRAAYDQVRFDLEESELVRDVISILGLLTARNEWYDGGETEEFRNSKEEDRLMDLVQSFWKKPRSLPGERQYRYETPAQTKNRWKYLINELREARAVLEDPDLGPLAKLGMIHGILVPAVWGQSTFEKRISGRALADILLNSDMEERIRGAIDATSVGIQTRLRRRFPDG